MRQAFSFKDGTIEMKVKLNDPRDALGINLADYDEKSSSANLAEVMLKPSGIRLEDLKTGQANLNIKVAKKRN